MEESRPPPPGGLLGWTFRLKNWWYNQGGGGGDDDSAVSVIRKINPPPPPPPEKTPRESRVSLVLSPEMERNIRKIDLSPLSWIEPADLRKTTIDVVKQVAALKYKTCGLPTTVRSKEDIRDILVSLGWAVPTDLSKDEIEKIESVTPGESCSGKIYDASVFPGKSRDHSFICVRIRRDVVQADCENTPLHIVETREPDNNNNKRKRQDSPTTQTKDKKTAVVVVQRLSKKPRTGAGGAK